MKNSLVKYLFMSLNQNGVKIFHRRAKLIIIASHINLFRIPGVKRCRSGILNDSNPFQSCSPGCSHKLWSATKFRFFNAKLRTPFFSSGTLTFAKR